MVLPISLYIIVSLYFQKEPTKIVIVSQGYSTRVVTWTRVWLESDSSLKIWWLGLDLDFGFEMIRLGLGLAAIKLVTYASHAIDSTSGVFKAQFSFVIHLFFLLCWEFMNEKRTELNELYPLAIRVLSLPASIVLLLSMFLSRWTNNEI